MIESRILYISDFFGAGSELEQSPAPKLGQSGREFPEKILNKCCVVQLLLLLLFKRGYVAVAPGCIAGRLSPNTPNRCRY